MIIKNLSKKTILASDGHVTKSFFERLLGLVGRKKISEGFGLVIKPCNSIHMFFMRFPIDVVFLDQENRVVYLISHLKPWRISKVVWCSQSVIELPIKAIEKTSTAIGDIIELGK